MSDSEVAVSDNPGRHRFEISVGAEVAGFVQYRDKGRQRSFIHTVIDPMYEGRGLASRLIRAALTDARERGNSVLPFCPFVRSYLLKHPGDLDLVARDDRVRFGLPEEATHA